MRNIKNILFDKSLIGEQENLLLEVVSENLEDYNNRLNTIISLEYKPQYFTIASGASKASDIFWFLAQHITSFINRDIDAQTFMDKILSVAKGRTTEYREKEALENPAVAIYIRMLYKWLKDYCPLVNLTDSQKEFFRSELADILSNFKARFPKVLN